MDCCGRTVAVAQNPCSCAAPVKYINKTISKQVPVNSMVTERVQVPCKVKKMVNEPYEVTVNMPMPGEETVEEKYFEYKDERYTEPVQRTTRIPIVTRQCTDASGKMIKIGEISKVPLHHSGPAPEKQAGRFVQNRVPAQAQAVQMTSQTQAPVSNGCQGSGCKPLSAFQRASLVNAPVDRMIGTGSLVQVGVVDPRLMRSNGSGWAKKNMMQGQWGGAYLAEKDAEVTEEASESDASDADTEADE